MNKEEIIELIKEKRTSFYDDIVEASNLRDSDENAERITINEHSVKKWEAESIVMALDNILNHIKLLDDAESEERE